MPATKSTSKTDKQTSSTGTKIFDVSHPGKSTPSATSRPVIVTHRSILQDPMMAGSTSEPMLTGKPADKVSIRPIGSNDSPPGSDQVKPSAPEVDIDLSSVLSTVTAEPGTDDKSKKVADEKDSADDTTDEPSQENADKGNDTPTEEGKATDDKTQASQEGQADPEELDNPADEATNTDETTNQETDTAGTPAADGTNVDSAEQKELAALEAKAKQEEAIDELAESKEYFLPVNSVEQHRSKVIAILGIVLIIVLALVLVDIMVDSGTIHIPGVRPVTHFFSV